MENTYLVAIIAVLVIVGAPIFRLHFAPSDFPANTKLPPGPEPIFFVGNVSQIPPIHSWLKFKEWSDKYGPIFRFSVFGVHHYVVSTEKIANELLRDRGANYSSREQLPAAAVLLGGSEVPLFLPVEPGNAKTKTWKNGRKFLHTAIGPNAVTAYFSIHDLESLLLISALIKEPEKYERWYERYAAGVVFRLTYGKAVDSGQEPYLVEALRTLRVTEHAASPGAYLVDVFPSMMMLPVWIAPWKSYLLKEGKAATKHFVGLRDEVRKEMAAGRTTDSFATKLLENQEETGLNDIEGAFLLGTLYGAGAGTTSATLISYTLAMVLHPQWQRKVQDEVDKIGDRLPNFDDLPNLPTVRAAVKETLRWRPVTAGGIPHKSVKDDVYDGYFIPAGTNIHPNLWAIHRDEVLYPDPETFNPARWLAPEFPTYQEPLTKFPNLQNYSAFGFGRRICPGQYLAERSLYIVAARLAWAVEFNKRRGSDGKAIEVSDWDYTSGFNTQPRAFAFDLKARDGKRVEVLEEALKQAMRDDPLRV